MFIPKKNGYISSAPPFQILPPSCEPGGRYRSTTPYLRLMRHRFFSDVPWLGVPFAAPHRSSFGTHLSPDFTSFITASSVTMLRDATIVRHRCVRLRGNPLRVYCTREKKNKGNGAFTVKCFAVMPANLRHPQAGPVRVSQFEFEFKARLRLGKCAQTTGSHRSVPQFA